MPGMDNVHAFLAELSAYAKAKGKTPDAICRAVTNNPRHLQRMEARAELLAADMERIRAHMAANPVGAE